MTGAGYAHVMAAALRRAEPPSNVENGFKEFVPWRPPDDGIEPPWFRPGVGNICEPCYLISNFIRTVDADHRYVCELTIQEHGEDDNRGPVY